LGNLLGGLAVLSTGFLSVGFGIYASYGVVLSVLSAFGRQSQRVAMLVPSESQAGGD
jgi:hypothetical protein